MKPPDEERLLLAILADLQAFGEPRLLIAHLAISRIGNARQNPPYREQQKPPD
jgi:hypothetical protein